MMFTEMKAKRLIVIPTNEQAYALFGPREENLRMLEQELDVHITSRGNEITLQGSPEKVEAAERLFNRLLQLPKAGGSLDRQTILYAARTIKEGGDAEELSSLHREIVVVTARGKTIRPKTIGQREYVRSIRDNGITFGIGPAGTGKTYLAMAMAITAFKNREYNRIILTRPAVEAGEKLGFLPGDLQEKVDPYLRPLYDAIYDILGAESFERYMGRGQIEVAPLAYMRGRTLDDSFIILDEAQNTTPEQMKMFLTRLGFGSKAVVTGDATQMDLPKDQTSGLLEATRILQGIEGIKFCTLTERDVVRHPLVQQIILAYERSDAVEQAEEAHSRREEPRP